MKKTRSIRVDKKSNEVKLTLNTIFYPKDNVLRTAEKFEDICWTKLEGDSGGCLSLSLQPKKQGAFDLEILGFEFMNHLLAEVKSNLSG